MKPRTHASLLAVVLTFFCVASAGAAGLLIPQGQLSSLDIRDHTAIIVLFVLEHCFFGVGDDLRLGFGSDQIVRRK